MNAKSQLGKNWREFCHRTTHRDNIHANSHISENTRQSKERGRRHGEATKSADPHLPRDEVKRRVKS